jgi:hypothetical protein
VSCPFLVRAHGAAVFHPNDPLYTHPGGASAVAALPDLDGMSMKLLQKVLDLKRHRCVKQNEGSEEEWVLAAYSDKEVALARGECGGEDEDGK